MRSATALRAELAGKTADVVGRCKSLLQKCNKHSPLHQPPEQSQSPVK
jgi:hypothetical protein